MRKIFDNLPIPIKNNTVLTSLGGKLSLVTSQLNVDLRKKKCCLVSTNGKTFNERESNQIHINLKEDYECYNCPFRRKKEEPEKI